MTEEQTKFLKLVTGPALDSEREFKVPAPITIAQSIIETNVQIAGVWTWGGSVLFRKANNPFGIKHEHRQNGGKDYGELDLPTREFIDGVPKMVGAGFQMYPDLHAAFWAHAMLLSGARRYRGFMAESALYLRAFDAQRLRGCAEELGPAIVVGKIETRNGPADDVRRGYSTNPKYAEDLLKLITEFHLDDRAVLKAFGAASEKAQGAAVPLGAEVMH